MKSKLSAASLCFGLLFPFSFHSFANTPAEMADLSLQELYAMSFEEMDQEYGVNLGLLFKHQIRDGYKMGTKDLSNDDVIFDKNELRTDHNYPILPTKIEQESLIFNLGFGIDEKNSISLSIPYIEQNTDHLSIVPGYNEFNISTSGLGDVAFNYQRKIYHVENRKIQLAIGLSLPTGSIDETGDTPRGPGDQQLPYTMQLGSGTFDVPLALSYSQFMSSYSFGVNVFAKLRLGQNDRHYRLGNRIALSSWIKYQDWHSIEPSLKLVFHKWGRISGQDDEITVPGEFPYPAGITNPNNFGGKQINIASNIDIMIDDHLLSAEISLPIFQNLNGIQPKEVLGFSLNWKSHF